MSKKLIPILICVFVAVLSLVATFSQEKPQEPPQKTTEVAISPKVPPADTYKICLEDDIVCLYTLSPDGTVLQKNKIDYIDVYSLFKYQQDMLTEGKTFDSREKAAEFIQDLGS